MERWIGTSQSLFDIVVLPKHGCGCGAESAIRAYAICERDLERSGILSKPELQGLPAISGQGFQPGLGRSRHSRAGHIESSRRDEECGIECWQRRSHCSRIEAFQPEAG